MGVAVWLMVFFCIFPLGLFPKLGCCRLAFPFFLPLHTNTPPAALTGAENAKQAQRRENLRRDDGRRGGHPRLQAVRILCQSDFLVASVLGMPQLACRKRIIRTEARSRWVEWWEADAGEVSYPGESPVAPLLLVFATGGYFAKWCRCRRLLLALLDAVECSQNHRRPSPKSRQQSVQQTRTPQIGPSGPQVQGLKGSRRCVPALVFPLKHSGLIIGPPCSLSPHLETLGDRGVTESDPPGGAGALKRWS